MSRLELPDGYQPGGWCSPLGENQYDLFEVHKTIAEQIVEDDIAEGLPHAVRGGIRYTCGWEGPKDASKEGAAESD